MKYFHFILVLQINEILELLIILTNSTLAQSCTRFLGQLIFIKLSIVRIKLWLSHSLVRILELVLVWHFVFIFVTTSKLACFVTRRISPLLSLVAFSLAKIYCSECLMFAIEPIQNFIFSFCAEPRLTATHFKSTLLRISQCKASFAVLASDLLFLTFISLILALVTCLHTFTCSGPSWNSVWTSHLFTISGRAHFQQGLTNFLISSQFIILQSLFSSDTFTVLHCYNLIFLPVPFSSIGTQ
jgi:hypothetical protein